MESEKGLIDMAYQFTLLSDSHSLDPLISAWRKTLTAPQDGMWEALRGYADHWEIRADNQRIGYACVNEEKCLLQFYILPLWMPEAVYIFQELIKQVGINNALIGTHNPSCLSIAMHVQKTVSVDTYLFMDVIEVGLKEQVGSVRLVETEDLADLIEFYHESMQAPKEWLHGYLGGLITTGEVFVLEQGEDILGAYEVRESASQAGIADIGMVVSQQHRKQGIGTYLLGQAKATAYQRNLTPICSCEADNIGSMKSIQQNGFRSLYQLLRMTF